MYIIVVHYDGAKIQKNTILSANFRYFLDENNLYVHSDFGCSGNGDSTDKKYSFAGDPSSSGAWEGRSGNGMMPLAHRLGGIIPVLLIR